MMFILFMQTGVFCKNKNSLFKTQNKHVQQVKKDRLEGQSLYIQHYSGPSSMARIPHKVSSRMKCFQHLLQS